MHAMAHKHVHSRGTASAAKQVLLASAWRSSTESQSNLQLPRRAGFRSMCMAHAACTIALPCICLRCFVPRRGHVYTILNTQDKHTTDGLADVAILLLRPSSQPDSINTRCRILLEGYHMAEPGAVCDTENRVAAYVARRKLLAGADAANPAGIPQEVRSASCGCNTVQFCMRQAARHQLLLESSRGA